jgi:hypothetical protein
MSEQDTSNSGLYVAAYFSDETNQNIAKYLSDNKIPNPIKSPGFHTTIVYSKVPVADFEPNHSIGIEVDTTGSTIEGWDVPSGTRCLVWHYESNYLHLRFQEAMMAGATYDFDEYKPHISLSYDIGDDFDVSTLPVPNFPIYLMGEYSEPIELDYEIEEDIFDSLFAK